MAPSPPAFLPLGDKLYLPLPHCLGAIRYCEKMAQYTNFCITWFEVCEWLPHFPWQNCAHGFGQGNTSLPLSKGQVHPDFFCFRTP